MSEPRQELSDSFLSTQSDDICIVLDVTDSMDNHIRKVLDLLPHYVVDRISRWKGGIERLGLVTIDDHYGFVGINEFAGETAFETRYVLSGQRGPKSGPRRKTSAIMFSGVTEDLEEYMYWIATQKTFNGGDPKECVLCGLAAAEELMPDAQIWLITEMPGFHYQCPLGITFSNWQNVNLLWCGSEWVSSAGTKTSSQIPYQFLNKIPPQRRVRLIDLPEPTYRLEDYVSVCTGEPPSESDGKDSDG